MQTPWAISSTAWRYASRAPFCCIGDGSFCSVRSRKALGQRSGFVPAMVVAGSEMPSTPATPTIGSSQLSSSRFSIDVPATAAQIRCRLSHHHRQHGIVPQFVVIVEVLITKRNPEHPPADQRAYRMLHQILSAVVAKHAANRSTKPIVRSVAPRSSATASEVTNPASKAGSTKRPSTTPKSSRSALILLASGLSSNHQEEVLAKQLSLIRSPDALKP